MDGGRNGRSKKGKRTAVCLFVSIERLLKRTNKSEEKSERLEIEANLT